MKEMKKMNLLDQHTEVIEGLRCWRAESSLLGWYKNRRESSGRYKESQLIFSILEEMGFQKTVYNHILSLGERDGEDSNLLGRVEVIYSDRDCSLTVRSRFDTIEIECLSELCRTIRGLWFAPC